MPLLSQSNSSLHKHINIFRCYILRLKKFLSMRLSTVSFTLCSTGINFTPNDFAFSLHTCKRGSALRFSSSGLVPKHRYKQYVTMCCKRYIFQENYLFWILCIIVLAHICFIYSSIVMWKKRSQLLTHLPYFVLYKIYEA